MLASAPAARAPLAAASGARLRPAQVSGTKVAANAAAKRQQRRQPRGPTTAAVEDGGDAPLKAGSSSAAGAQTPTDFWEVLRCSLGSGLRLALRAKLVRAQLVAAPCTHPRAAPLARAPQGEQWEGLGKAFAQFLLPALALAALGVGFFAASTYNEGATVGAVAERARACCTDVCSCAHQLPPLDPPPPDAYACAHSLPPPPPPPPRRSSSKRPPPTLRLLS